MSIKHSLVTQALCASVILTGLFATASRANAQDSTKGSPNPALDNIRTLFLGDQGVKGFIQAARTTFSTPVRNPATPGAYEQTYKTWKRDAYLLAQIGSDDAVMAITNVIQNPLKIEKSFRLQVLGVFIAALGQAANRQNSLDKPNEVAFQFLSKAISRGFWADAGWDTDSQAELADDSITALAWSGRNGALNRLKDVCSPQPTPTCLAAEKIYLYNSPQPLPILVP